MRVPMTWLREYVHVGASTGEIADRLASSTCEVERIARVGVPDQDGNLGLFRVGRVVEAGKHPNADRLQLCRVDVGESEPRQIVCGAWNFGEGATVAVALPGAVLPDGQRLEEVKLRGQRSSGMILSERELELGADHTGIIVLEEGPEPGTPLADVLPLGEEVLEIESTPNRADLLSVYGVAREVAAIFDGELAPVPGADPEVAGDAPVDIRIEDLERCPRYVGRLFRDARIGPSPPWLRARLTAAGMRPISNVVDATNYVMHALGNPLHAFDHAHLAEGRIVVRRAAEGEQIRTLDGQVRTLIAEDLVIADAVRPVAIAGIMGGGDSEVSEQTTEVLLEAANFEPSGIQRSSERLGLRSEASGRWEKGIDPYLAPAAATFCSELIADLAGARWVGESDVHGALPEPPVITLRPERAGIVMGLEVSVEEQRRILVGLGFAVSPEGREVRVPTWRMRDVTREIDLVEEIARMKLEEIAFTLPRRQEMFGRLSLEQRLRREVEDALVGAGFSEAYTPSLVAEDPDPRALRIPQPQSQDMAVLRTTLLPSLFEAARYNQSVGNTGIFLFEIAHVYLSADGLPEEPVRIGGVTEGPFARAKGAVETVLGALGIEGGFRRSEHPLLHPGKTATLEFGVLGEVRPGTLEGAWSAFELDLAGLAAAAPSVRAYEDVITYPALRQDLAFAVDEDVAAGDLAAAAREAAGEDLRAMTPFDVYRGEQVGEGRKSVAFRVEFRSPERTLTDEDAAGLRERIVEALRKRFGAELRA
ncbi:MAG TPA: phenylalanine--tRNA ligase subunit beta [Gaiellaceae bacterium]|nr:phenylalanine--tRNA ligase subunit beta [Gaiellaceae bacterium]